MSDLTKPVLNFWPAQSEEDANYNGAVAMDELVAWFVERDYDDDDIRDRFEDALERARDGDV